MNEARNHVAAIAMRSIERRGIYLSDEEYRALSDGVRAGLYRCTGTSNGAPVHELPVKGITIYAVWSREHDCIRAFVGSMVKCDRVADMKAKANRNFKLHLVTT